MADQIAQAAPQSQQQALSRPDAMLVPAAWKQGGDIRARVNSVLDTAEPVMGVKCRVSHLGDSVFVVPAVSVDADSSYFYPDGHDLARQPRYNWFDTGNGVWYGYKKDVPASGASGAGRAPTNS